MNLFTEELSDWDEPHTPRWQYHCRDHPDLELMKYNHAHFQTGHQGKDPNRIRVRCQGILCIHCVPVPAPEEDDRAGKNEENQIAPKSSAPDSSQTENDSPSEEESQGSEDEDLSEKDNCTKE